MYAPACKLKKKHKDLWVHKPTQHYKTFILIECVQSIFQCQLVMHCVYTDRDYTSNWLKITQKNFPIIWIIPINPLKYVTCKHRCVCINTNSTKNQLDTVASTVVIVFSVFYAIEIILHMYVHPTAVFSLLLLLC